MKSVVTMVVLFLCVTKTVSLLSGSAQTSTQLLRKNSCELNMTSFETIMEKYKAYGEDRLLVVGMFEASAGTGKSTAASLVVGCPNAYHSACTNAGDLTKGVHINTEPLSCCALAYIHKFSMEACECKCLGDDRDLDPSTNTCPLVAILDVEGSLSTGQGNCSLAPFYLLSKVHIRILRSNKKYSFTELIQSSAILANHLSEAMRKNEAAGVRTATGHQLHFLNFNNRLESALNFLDMCETNDQCTGTSASLKYLRDEVYSFYGRENMKEIRTPDLFQPVDAPEKLFMKDNTCKDLTEIQIHELNTALFTTYMSPQFLTVWQSYLADSLAPALSTGLVLPLLSASAATGQKPNLTVSGFKHLMPVLVHETAGQGCPQGSFICGMEAARCAAKLMSLEILDFLSNSYVRATLHVKTSANILEVIAAEAEFAAHLQANLIASGKVPPECVLPSGVAFIPAAQAVFDASLANYKLSLSKVAAERLKNRTVQHAHEELHGRTVGIFETKSAEAATSVMRSVLESGTMVQRDHETDGPLIVVGYQLTIDNDLALGSAAPHGGDVFIRVHSLVVPPGEWTIYAPGRNVTIEANVLKVEGHLHINVSGCPADSHNTSARSGGDFGAHGSSGEAGRKGNDAGSVIVRVLLVEVKNDASLTLSAVGGSGGDGQKGGDGFKGSRGTEGKSNGCNLSNPVNGQCSSNGDNGGRGHNGGNGGKSGDSGNGGNGGTATFLFGTLTGAVSVNVSTFVEGGQGGWPVPGGGPGGGGEGGTAGFGTHISCNRGDCRTDRTTNQGQVGEAGSPGSRGLPGKAGVKGAGGTTTVTQVHGLCSEMSSVGADSAVMRAKLRMLDHFPEVAAELLQEVLSLSDFCADDPAWHSVWSEAGLLLAKLDRGEDLFGFAQNFVPALHAEFLLNALDKNLVRMEAVASASVVLSAGHSAVVAAQKKCKEMLADVEVTIVEKEVEYKATWERYSMEDQLCKDLGGNILTAETEAHRQVQLLEDTQNDALRRKEVEQNEARKQNQPSKSEKALGVLTNVISSVSTAATAFNFASSIPAAASSFAATLTNWKNKIKDSADTKMIDFQNIQKLSKKVPKVAQDLQQRAEHAVHGYEKLRDRASQLPGDPLGLGSNLVSTMSEAPAQVQQDPVVQRAYANVAYALSALEQTVDALNQANMRRSQKIAELEQILLETLRLRGIAANLRSEQVVRTYDANILTANSMLTRQATSAIYEQVLLNLDAARRALSAQFLTNIQWSPSFVDQLSLVTTSSLQHSPLHDSTLTVAMRLELTLLQTRFVTALEAYRHNEIEVTNLQWSLPVWTQLALQRGELVTVMLPWDHPSFANCIRLGVTSVQVVIKRVNNSEPSPPLLMLLTHLGDSTVRNADGELHRFDVPPCQWRKNIDVMNETADLTTARFSNNLGIGSTSKYSAMSPFATYTMRIIVTDEANQIPQDISDVVIIFNGTTM